MEIYYTTIKAEISRNKIDYYLSLVSEESRAKFKRFHFIEDSLRSLYGELLIRRAAAKSCGCSEKELRIGRSEHGKPFLYDCKMEFNISHGGDFVVCAVAEQPVGVDVEPVRDIDLGIARRFFHPSECELIMGSEDSRSRFFDLWTLKESYVKWLGKGLSQPLNSFCFDISGERISLIGSRGMQENLSFKIFEFSGCKCAVCTEEEPPKAMQWIDAEELI